MGIFVSTNIFGYEIYKEEEKFRGPDYYMVDADKKESIKKINFDIDTRGGLKIVELNTYVSSLPENAQLILKGVSKDGFIPVTASPYMHDNEKLNIWDDEIYEIFENRYLKHKVKYVIWDGVVEKVKFSHNEDRLYVDKSTIGINHFYSFID